MRCQKCGLTNSPTARFCKQCGTPMPRSAEAAVASQPAAHAEAVEAEVGGALEMSAAAADLAVGMAAPAVSEALVDTQAVTSAATVCPQCSTERVGGKRFCRACRFDFSTLPAANLEGAAADAAREAEVSRAAEAQAIAQREADARAAEERRAAEAQAATQREAEARAAEKAVEQSRAAEAQAAAQREARARAAEQAAEHRRAAEAQAAAQREAEARAAAEQAAEQRHAAEAQTTAQPEAEERAAAAQATDAEPCPTCSTPRASGKRFCRTCRFDFVERIAHNEPPTVISEDPSTPVPTIDHLDHKIEETEAASPAEKPVFTPPPSGSDARPTPPTGQLNQPGSDAGNAPTQPRVETDTAPPANRNRTLLIGSIAVVVLGIAVGAGLYLRSQHAKPTGDQPQEASTPAAAMAAPASDIASAATPADAQQPVAASQPDAQPAMQPAASGPANVVDSSAPATPATPASQADLPAAPHPVEPSTANNAPAPEPAPEAPPAAPQPEAATTPPVHPKPRKPAAPPADASEQNPTIRAAINGSLADGTRCFGNKKYDCAISNADAVLRLDPRNSQALSLRNRAKSAQDNALNSLSIQ